MSLLEVTDLVKSFGGLNAVRNLTIQLAENQILGLIGPNGAGKTTFFNCIAGVYPPTSGKVMLNGTEITGQ